jgi:hypothetical protein
LKATFVVKALAKARKVGGSIVVTLPKELVQTMKIRGGELVEITVKKCRVNGFGALKGIGPFMVDDELKVHE